jgi:hypothetical protein
MSIMFVNCRTVLQILLAVMFLANSVQTKLDLTKFFDDGTQLSGHQAILKVTDHGKMSCLYLKNSSSCNITHILLILKRSHSLIKSDFIIKQNYNHCHEGSACNMRAHTHTKNINVFINWFISECLVFLTDPVSCHFCNHLLLFIY